MTRCRPGHPLPHLAPAELEVMKALWAGGKLSAREIHERVAQESGWAYSTTRTILERMVSKGLAERGRFHGLHLYSARLSRPLGLAALVKSFAEQVLELRRVPVATLFSESEALSPEEIEELRALLDDEGRSQRSGDR